MPLFELAKNTFKDEIRDYYCGLTFTETLIKHGTKSNKDDFGAEEMKKRVEEALKLLDIWQYRDRNPFDLSGGQMQRVAIASVLVMRPDVMILDEPTSSLDDGEVEKLFKLMLRLKGEGVGIIFVTHFLEQVYAVCDRIRRKINGKKI